MNAKELINQYQETVSTIRDLEMRLQEQRKALLKILEENNLQIQKLQQENQEITSLLYGVGEESGDTPEEIKEELPEVITEEEEPPILGYVNGKLVEKLEMKAKASKSLNMEDWEASKLSPVDKKELPVLPPGRHTKKRLKEYKEQLLGTILFNVAVDKRLDRSNAEYIFLNLIPSSINFDEFRFKARPHPTCDRFGDLGLTLDKVKQLFDEHLDSVA